MGDDASEPRPDADATKAAVRAAQTVEVAHAVRASAKYAAIDPALIVTIAAQELAKGARVKDAVKQVKNRLHQSVAAYWDRRADFTAWRAALEAAPDDAAQRTVLQTILRTHHSTRERMPMLAEFYRTLFGGLGPLRGVLDLGCGLNPLTLPWMGLPAETAYFACDVDRGQMDFLAWWLAHTGRRGQAFVWNLLDGPPHAGSPMRAEQIDVALLLKVVPCLAQLDRQIGARLLDAVPAPVLIVSFPAQSLGGRRKGMIDHYSAEMNTLLAGRAWKVERFDFPSELVFRLST